MVEAAVVLTSMTVGGRGEREGGTGCAVLDVGAVGF